MRDPFCFAGEWGVSGDNYMFIIFLLVKIRFHTKNNFHRFPGSGLKVSLIVRRSCVVGFIVLLKTKVGLRSGVTKCHRHQTPL